LTSAASPSAASATPACRSARPSRPRSPSRSRPPALLGVGPIRAKYPDVPLLAYGDGAAIRAFIGDKLYNAVYPGTEVGSLTRKDVLTMTAAVLDALRSVPRPFALVEAGALCGHSSLLIAALMHRYCADCQYYIYDPRLWRPADFMDRVPGCAERGPVAYLEQKLSKKALGQVHYFNDYSDEMTLLPLPVGLAFLDGGKHRQTNAAIQAIIEAQMPVGGVFAYHDAGRWISGDNYDVRKDWLLQYAQGREMVSTGRYEVLRQGLVENNQDEVCTRARARAHH
jgi:hypothetical protein